MAEPLATVFTSSFNHGKYLAEAIESVLAQTFADFEYLLYDDGSTDNTWSIMLDFAAIDNRIRATKLPKAITKAPVLNRSVREAKGKFWTWCPADDIWNHNLLQKKLDFSAKCGHNSVLYSDFDIIDQDGNFIGTTICSNYSKEEFAALVWKQSPIGFTGIWIPLSVFEEVGFFPEDPNIFSEDFYWMIKATIHDVCFQRVPEVLYSKRKHSSSTTSKNLHKMEEQVQSIRKELALYKQSFQEEKSL